MSILDDITSTFNRGAEAAGRASSSTRIKGQMNSLLKQRQSLCAQLGASLYDEIRDNAALREGREALFDEIAAIDTQRAELQAQLDELQAAAEASVAAAQTLSCPDCGTRVSVSDMFCSGCGKPVADIKAAAEAEAAAAAAAQAAQNNVVPQAQPGELACPTCGCAVSSDDAFCVNCGTKLEGVAVAAAAEPAPVPVPEPEPELAPEPEPEPKTKEKPKAKSRSSRSKKKDPKAAAEPKPAAEPVLEPAVESVPEPELVAEPEMPTAIVEPAPAPVPTPEPEPAPVVVPVPEPQAASCPVCGAPIKESDKFCIKCGTPLGVAAPAAVAATEAICPACGATVRPQDKFCLKCGQPL